MNKRTLLTSIAVLLLVATGAAHAADPLVCGIEQGSCKTYKEPLPDWQIITCSGLVYLEPGKVYKMECKAIKGEDFDIDVQTLPNKDIDWLHKVCPLYAIGKDIAGMRSNRCRIQIMVKDSEKSVEFARVYEGLKLLHVTNKVKFSWE